MHFSNRNTCQIPEKATEAFTRSSRALAHKCAPVERL